MQTRNIRVPLPDGVMGSYLAVPENGKLEKAVPMTKLARCLQIESKICALIKYEMAANIPLVE